MSNPFSFDDIIGHNTIKRRLSESLQKHSHAYIFEGESGSGRFCVAKVFAHSLHCENNGIRPCGHCPSCVKHKQGNHTDLLVFDRGDKSSFGVESVREIISEVFTRPISSNKKIFILKDGEYMTAESQNALLKALEEPPSYAVIIIITQFGQTLLPTIRSRAALVEFLPHSDRIVRAFLNEKYPDKTDIIKFAAAYSGGLLGNAVTIVSDEDFLGLRKKFYEVYGKMPEKGASIIYELLALCEDNPDGCCKLMLTWLRDCVMIKTGLDNDIINSDFENAISIFANNTHMAGVLKSYDILSEFMRSYNKGHNKKLWLTKLLLDSWEALHVRNSGS